MANAKFIMIVLMLVILYDAAGASAQQACRASGDCPAGSKCPLCQLAPCMAGSVSPVRARPEQCPYLNKKL